MPDHVSWVAYEGANQRWAHEAINTGKGYGEVVADWTKPISYGRTLDPNDRPRKFRFKVAD